MSPSALALALLLHGLALAALLWVSQIPREHPSLEDAIEVSFEQPKPEPPPPPPPPPAPATPPAPIIPGLRPPAPLTSDNPTQVPPAATPSKEASAPQPPSLQEFVPLEPQPPPPTSAEFGKLQPPKPEPPTPQPHPAPPQEHAMVTPTRPMPAPPMPRPPELLPSPLRPAPQRQAPSVTPHDQASPSPFINPADSYNRARVADNYLWQVVQRLVGYRYHAHVAAAQGVTVVTVVIARNGRLLDVSIAQSSGYPEFDRGVLAGVRAGAPYAPLPPEIHGDSATFTLPLVSVQRQ